MVSDVVTPGLPRIRATPPKLTRPHSWTKLPHGERKTPTDWACKGFRQHGSVSMNARDEPTLHTLLLYTTSIQTVEAHPNTTYNSTCTRTSTKLVYELPHPLSCETIRSAYITSHKER